jgi:hypothetical protein
MIKRLVGLLLALAHLTVFGVFVAIDAQARWRAEYASQPAAVREWFGNAQLTKPAHDRLGFWGCCEISEVVRTRFRVDRASGADQWFYLKDDRWELVPADIIHWGESAPDGEATLFVLAREHGGHPAGTPTCFWPPRGGN